MLFFGVFLRETAHPVAKSRTNVAQIQEKLPNGWTDWHKIWHTCADSSGNGYMPNKLNTRGIWGGFRGSQIQVWEDVKRLDRLAPNLVVVWEWT